MRKNLNNELPKIRVIIRDDKKKNAEGKYTLNYAIRFQGRTIKKSTGLYIDSKLWNKKKAQVTGNTNELLRIQGKLNDKKADFNKYFLHFDATGGKISRKVIDDYFEDRRFDDFFSYFNGVIERLEDLTEVTINKYKICLKILRKFSKKEKLIPLRFRDITLQFLQDFDSYLVVYRKPSSDTANNYHKCFKYVLKKAVLDGILDRSPYFGFKPLKTNSRKKVIPLTTAEVEVLEDLEIPENRLHLENIRDYFLFMLNTGVRYSDLFQLKIDHITPSNLGDEFTSEGLSLLHFRQQKTGNIAVVPLNKLAKDLVRKYCEFYELEGGYIFPKITNQVFNRQLKDLAELADLKRGLNCHLARHTFASRLRSKNVPLEDVSELLGHSSIKMTKIYAKNSMKNLLDAVELL